MFIGASLYFGLRRAIMLCLLATAAGLVVPLSERWFATPDKQKLRARVATAIIGGGLFVTVGLIRWAASGDRRLAGVLVPIGVMIVVLAWIARRSRGNDA